jgi:hypothetical protein
VVFLNSSEDMEWLRVVHLPNLPKKYLSAVIYGNEDSPERIDTYTEVSPLCSEEPLIHLALDDELVPVNDGDGWVFRLFI